MPIAKVQLPDGRVGRFEVPDGTTPEQVMEFVNKGGVEPQKEQKGFLQSAGETLRDATTGAVKGLTSGFSDELYGALQTPIRMTVNAVKGIDEGKSLGERISGAYESGLNFERGQQKEASQRSPIASTGGEIGGGLALGAQLGGGPVLAGATTSPTVARAATEAAKQGAAYGAAYGFGTGEGTEDRLSNAMYGGATGALTGGVLGAVSGKMAQNAANKTVPTTDALRQQANSLYDTAEKAGVVLSQPSIKSIANDLAYDAMQAGIDKTIHPKATAAVQRIADASNGTPTLKDMDLLRRVMGAAAKSNDADERRIASLLIDKLDDRLESLTPNDVLAGDANLATQALSGARDLWGRMRRSETIEGLIDSAKLSASQFSGSGYENALRTQFRALAKNDKRMRGFSGEEQDAIRKVAQGGPIENVLRFLGKLSPSGVISGAAGTGAGYAMGGPVGAAALPAAGWLARQGATAMTGANANRAALLARSGGQLPAPQSLSPQQQALIQALLRGTTQQGGMDEGYGLPLARALSTSP